MILKLEKYIFGVIGKKRTNGKLAGIFYLNIGAKVSRLKPPKPFYNMLLRISI